jgi:hypothetical protein
MSDIFIMIRNQANAALTSIEGIAFVTLLQQDGQVIAEEGVDLFYADAGFDDLPLGQYTVVVRHEQVEPTEAVYNVIIRAIDEVILLTFVYSEPERVLLRVEASTGKRL